MADRDAPDDFKDHLAGELEGWARDGLIAPEQAQAILARYALRPGALRAFRLGPVATLISVVGALVLAMGVIYFFAANWSLLPAWSKIALVYAGVGTSYGAGYILQFRRQTLPRVGASLLLLGALLFQAGFFLLAQICNMPVNSPILLLLGAVGILPLAYLVRSRLVLTLGLADALTWLGWQLADRYQSAPESFAVALVYMLAGIVVYSAGQLHRQRRSFTNFVAVYGVLGLLAVFLPAYVLSFGYFWKEAASSGITSLRVPLRFVGALVLALLAAASLLLPLQSWRRLGTENRRDPLLLAEVAVFAIIALAVGLVAFVPRWAGGYAVVFN